MLGRLCRTSALWLPFALLFRHVANAQDLSLAPVASGPLVGKPLVLAAAYQLFPAGRFDLAGKQTTFAPTLDNDTYTITTDSLSAEIDLNEAWEVADEIATVPLGAPFTFAGIERMGARIHPAGYITFNDSNPPMDVDCMNASTYATEDVIVALCVTETIALVRYASLDDRLVVQWALPWGSCPGTAPAPSPHPMGAGAPGPGAPYMLVAQAELGPAGAVRLSWTAESPCSTAVGVGSAIGGATQLEFAALAAQLGPAALDCSSFSVAENAAYPCAVRKSAVLPAALPPVVLIAGSHLVEQQVVTIVNVAGQEAAESGVSVPATAPSPVAASPAGLSRSARGLRQVPAASGIGGGGGGGFALLQGIEGRISASLKALAPTLAREILGLNYSSLNAPTGSIPSIAPYAAGVLGAPPQSMAPQIAAQPQSAMPPVLAPLPAPTTAPAPMPAAMQLPVLPSSESPLAQLPGGAGPATLPPADSPALAQHVTATVPVSGMPGGSPAVEAGMSVGGAPGGSVLQMGPRMAPMQGPTAAPSPTSPERGAQQPISSRPTTIVLNGPSSVVIGGATPAVGSQPSSAGGTGRRLLQSAQAPLLPTLSSSQAAPGLGPAPMPTASPPALGPAVAPLSVEARSGAVTAVGIRETPPRSSVRQPSIFVPAPACSQPRQAGPCDRYSTRWYYDAATTACGEFAFGGCLGNLNNFATRLSCEQACVAGTQPPKEAETAAEVSIPGPDELVFLASALTTKKWVTLDATSGVLPAGASAALHLTYNGTSQSLGAYTQTVTINSNDPSRMQTRLQVSMYLFCARLRDTYLQPPTAPAVTYASLTGTPPEWAAGVNVTDGSAHVYFELDVVADSPIAELGLGNLEVDAGGESGVLISVGELAFDSRIGPMCSAWRVRGAAPLPEYYAYDDEGLLLTATVSGLKTVYGAAVPETSANKTLYNSLPQCTLYGLGMVFGGDFGLAVASNASSARAVLVCTTPMQGLCSDCIVPEHTSPETDMLDISFFGEVPGKTAQYDIEVSWPAGEFFGGVNLTIACNATDDVGRPLAAVAPLPFAVVANPQLIPPQSMAFPPAEPMPLPDSNPYGTGPRPRANETGPATPEPAAADSGPN